MSKDLLNEAFLKLTISTSIRDFAHDNNLDENYVETDVFSYKDGSRERLAIFVAFIQSYENPVEFLDEKMLAFLVDKVKEMKVDDMVDDICVNFLQWRKGELVENEVGL